VENNKKYDFVKKAPYLFDFVQLVINNNSDINTGKVVSQNEINSYKSLGSNLIMPDEKNNESTYFFIHNYIFNIKKKPS